MEGLFTVQNLAIIVTLAALAVPPLIWCGCHLFAQNDVIAEAMWAAQFGKTPPEGEDV